MQVDCFVAALLAMTRLWNHTSRRGVEQPKTERTRGRQRTQSGLISNANKVDAGWSSPVARQAHNLKVTGSNPVPATKSNNAPREKSPGRFLRLAPGRARNSVSCRRR